jgi:hypothetical protein
VAKLREEVCVWFLNLGPPWLAKSIPNRLVNKLCIHVFAKKSKKHISNVWQLGFAILLTWQIEEKDSHICQAPSHLASHHSRKIRRPRAWSRDYSLLPPSDFLFFCQVINVKSLKIASFYLCHFIWNLANSLVCQTNYANGWGYLGHP